MRCLVCDGMCVLVSSSSGHEGHAGNATSCLSNVLNKQQNLIFCFSHHSSVMNRLISPKHRSVVIVLLYVCFCSTGPNFNVINIKKEGEKEEDERFGLISNFLVLSRTLTQTQYEQTIWRAHT